MSLLDDLISGTDYERTERIKVLKRFLSETDYKAIKYAEGQMSEQEYAETKAQRQTWREEINTLEHQQ